jgi:hypothetical protein
VYPLYSFFLKQYIAIGLDSRKLQITCQIEYLNSIPFYYNIQTQYLKISDFQFFPSIAVGES